MKTKLSVLKKYAFLWLPVIAWAVVIFSFSNYPTTRASEIHWQDFIVKKTAHIVEYAILTTLLYRALLGGKISKIKAGYVSIAIAIIYAITDEFHQSFVPGREATLRDVLFDTLGSVAAIYYIQHLLPNANNTIKRLAKAFQIA